MQSEAGFSYLKCYKETQYRKNAGKNHSGILKFLYFNQIFFQIGTAINFFTDS